MKNILSDVKVGRRDGRMLLEGITPAGISWLKNNIWRNASMVVSVSLDGSSEVIAEMKGCGLVVEGD